MTASRHKARKTAVAMQTPAVQTHAMIKAVAPAKAGEGLAAKPSPATMRTWFRFFRLHQKITMRATHELRAIGLSIPQFDLLSTVWEHEGVSQQEIAERLYVTKGNVSGLVDRLAAADLLERRSLPNDRRSYALHLTAKGRELVEHGFRLQNSLVNATLGALPETDRADLDRVLVSWRDVMRTLPTFDGTADE